MTMFSTVQYLSMPSAARKGIVLLQARLRRLVNGWVAAAIARHERRAASAGLRRPDAREAPAVGLYRGPMDGIVDRASRALMRRIQLSRRRHQASNQTLTTHGRRR